MLLTVLMLMLMLLLFGVERCWGVRCVYCDDSFDWSWSNVSWKELDERMNDLMEISDYDQSKNELCRLEIYLDYQLNRSSISFGDSFQWTELNREELRLDYLIRLERRNDEEKQQQQQEEFYNVLEYACANEEQCERNTLHKHLQWLINIDYSLFHQHLQTLFFDEQTNSTGFSSLSFFSPIVSFLFFSSLVKTCLTDKKTFQPCSTGSCSARYSTYYENIQSECSPYPSTSTEVHLTINLIYNQFYQSIQEAKILRYLCQFDQCNDEQFTQRFTDLVNQHFPLDPMREAFLQTLRIDIDIEEEATTSSPSTPIIPLLKGERISFQLDRLSQSNSVPRSAHPSIHLAFLQIIYSSFS